MAIKAVKLASGNYRARVSYIGDDDKEHVESFTRGTKKEAEAAANEFKVNRAKALKPENISLGAAADKFIDSNMVLSPSTIASYRGIRNNACQDIINKRIGSLTTIMIQESISKYAIGRKAKTVKNALSFFKRVLKSYKLDQLCDEINIPQADAKEIKIPSEKELNEFLDRIIGSRLYIYVLFACFAGLRRSEVLALKWKDVDLDEQQVSISKARIKNEFGQYVIKNTPKTVKSNRKVILVDVLYNALQEAGKDKKPDESVIDDEPDALKDAYERARIKYKFPYNYHALRHYFTSYLLLIGAPLKDVSEILGHSTMQTTQRVYLHTFPETKREVFSNLNSKISHGKNNVLGETADQVKPES